MAAAVITTMVFDGKNIPVVAQVPVFLLGLLGRRVLWLPW